VSEAAAPVFAHSIAHSFAAGATFPSLKSSRAPLLPPDEEEALAADPSPDARRLLDVVRTLGSRGPPLAGRPEARWAGCAEARAAP
jgi:hypothetical protein